MKECPKCNSKNIKKYPHSARRETEAGQYQEQGDQTVNYACLDCGNTKSVKFSEDNSLEA